MLAQHGHLVGAPTALPAGELALRRPVSGEVPRPEFTDALAQAASRRWTGSAAVALTFAGSHAALGDAVACRGMLAAVVTPAELQRAVEAVGGILGVEPLRPR